MDGKRRYNGAQPPPKRLNMPPADGDDEPGMDMMEEEEMADVDVFMGEETFMEAELESLPVEEVQRKLDSWARPRPQDINIYKDSIGA